jgi:hypothetical protein
MHLPNGTFYRGCVFSASLGQIGPAAARSAHFLGDSLYDLASV